MTQTTFFYVWVSFFSPDQDKFFFFFLPMWVKVFFRSMCGSSFCFLFLPLSGSSFFFYKNFLLPPLKSNGASLRHSYILWKLHDQKPWIKANWKQFQVFNIAKFESKVTVHYSLWAKCTQLWPLNNCYFWYFCVYFKSFSLQWSCF